MNKVYKALGLSNQILHKHCFLFLLGLTMVSRENKNNRYSKFGWKNKEYYGIFRFGQLDFLILCVCKGRVLVWYTVW